MSWGKVVEKGSLANVPAEVCPPQSPPAAPPLMLPSPLTRACRQPAIEAVNAAIKEAADRIQGKVKVTAFDYLAPAPLAPAGGTCDLLVFPAGISFRGLPLEQLPAAVLSALTGGASADEERQQQQQQQQQQQAGEEVQGDTLFVCCHAARDERCGVLGPPLAAKLAELLEHRGMASSMRVLKTSHVGGHKVRQAGLGRPAGWQGWQAGMRLCLGLGSGSGLGCCTAWLLTASRRQLSACLPICPSPCSTPAMCWCTAAARPQTATGLVGCTPATPSSFWTPSWLPRCVSSGADPRLQLWASRQ